MDVPVKEKSWHLTTVVAISLHGVGGCQTHGGFFPEKNGSISAGTRLAFATTWIGSLPDLIGEVKLSAIRFWQTAVRVGEVS